MIAPAQALLRSLGCIYRTESTLLFPDLLGLVPQPKPKEMKAVPLHQSSNIGYCRLYCGLSVSQCSDGRWKCGVGSCDVLPHPLIDVNGFSLSLTAAGAMCLLFRRCEAAPMCGVACLVPQTRIERGTTLAADQPCESRSVRCVACRDAGQWSAIL
jgi:hypothetical protein